MKKSLWLIISLALIMPQTASAQSKNSIFELLVNSKTFDSNDTYVIGSKEKGNLAEIELYFPDAVQLDTDGPSDVAKLAVKKETILSANTVFYAADNKKTIYCAHTWINIRISSSTACLIDKDHDGYFEEISKAGNNFINPPLLLLDSAIDMKGSTAIGGAIVSRGIFFPKPLAYHHISPSELPISRMTGQIFAISDYNKKSPGLIHFAFAVGIINNGTYANSYSEFREITFSGTPVSVDLNGIKITVIGIDKKGNPICKLEGQINHKVLPFLLQNIITRIYY